MIAGWLESLLLGNMPHTPVALTSKSPCFGLVAPCCIVSEFSASNGCCICCYQKLFLLMYLPIEGCKRVEAKNPPVGVRCMSYVEIWHHTFCKNGAVEHNTLLQYSASVHKSRM